MLKCQKCGEIKAESEFYQVSKDKNKRGFSSWCKSCFRAYAIDYQQKHRQIYKERKRKAQISARYTIVAQLGGRCEICGYSKCYSALEIHGEPEIEKAHRIWYLTKKGRSKLLQLHKQGQIRLLCSTHHTELHHCN